jgi:hypothetical protein
MKKQSNIKKIDKQTKGKTSNIPNNPNLDAKSPDSITAKTYPYEIFTKCISRAENLLYFEDCSNDNSCQKKISKNHIDDCYRAAIVLSISALDTFIRTIVSIKINKVIVIEKKVSHELRRYIFSILSQEELFEAVRKNDFPNVLDRAINLNFSNQSFQSTKKIISFLQLVGYKNIFDNVAKKINIHKGNLIEDLDKYTDRRHIIVHCGDYDLEQTDSKEREITSEYTKKCIKTIKDIVKAINEITEDKK